MNASLVLVIALLGSTAATASICTDAAGDEAKTVTWLRGDYGVLGSMGAGHSPSTWSTP